MMSAAFIRARRARREWPVRRAPRRFVAVVAVTALFVLAGMVVALVRSTWSVHGVQLLLLLAALAVIFEEGARRAARLRLRLSAPLKTDMTSVWAISAAVGLGSGQGVLLLGVVLVAQDLPADAQHHRPVAVDESCERGFRQFASMLGEALQQLAVGQSRGRARAEQGLDLSVQTH